jgi:DNA-binding MarR family transcriptional regulator
VAEDSDPAATRGSGDNLGFRFRLAHQAFRRALTDALAPYELTVPQYGALSAFDTAAEMSSAELARLAAVTPQTMNALVHQLVKRSLLERRGHPTHAKVVVLHLSRRGRRLLDQATPKVRATEHAALDEINDHDAQVVNTWLVWVAARFSQQPLPPATNAP